jgi:acetyl esterase/lipase
MGVIVLKKPVVPQDTTMLPGMKTIMCDAKQSYEVKYLNDVEYVKRDGAPLVMQMLMPELPFPPGAPASRDYPLVVYVQGSAWLEQNCYLNIPQLCDLARRGYVVASVKYRSSEIAKWPAFLQDVKSAIRFLRANCKKFYIDPDQVAIWGDSSGGHASLMTAFTGDMEEFKTEDNHDVSDKVDVCVDFYGPTDVTKINSTPRNPIFTADKNHIPEDILFGGVVTEHPEISEPGNPLNYVSKNKDIPPVLIMHGDMDGMVPFNQSVLIYQKLVECGKPVEFYKVLGADHGVRLWTKQAVDIVADFIGAYLK